VAEQASGTDQIAKRATNLLKAAAMSQDDLDDAQAAEQERIKARDGFLLVWELLWFALNNRGGKGKQQSPPSAQPSRAQQMRRPRRWRVCRAFTGRPA
jgi:hypothetical protein